MEPKIDAYIEDLAAQSDLVAIWRHTAAFTGNLGFDGCSLTLARPSQAGIASIFVRSSICDNFEYHYTHDRLFDSDPFLLAGCGNLSAKRFSLSQLPKDAAALNSDQEFLAHLAERGIRNGLGVPVRTKGEHSFGGWVFSSSEDDKTYGKADKEYGRTMQLAGVLAYERMVALGVEQPALGRALSDRERECLLWLCAGFRVSIIAERLQISESAVNLYISNAKHKLGAKTREQAIARAIFGGQINI